MPHNPKRFWITATDTDAGKTTVICTLLKALNAQGHTALGYKPIASGSTHQEGSLYNQDALAIQSHSSQTRAYNTINPWCFEPAIAPHIAAQWAQTSLSKSSIIDHLNTQASTYPNDILLAEGAGGVCIPLNETEHTLDLMRDLQWPVILVIGLKLGALNHAQLSQIALETHEIPIAAWLTKQMAPMDALDENIETLSQVMTAPCLGHIPYFENTPTVDQCIPYLNLKPLYEH